MLGVSLLEGDQKDEEDQKDDAPGDARIRKYGFLILAVDDDVRDFFIDHMVLNYETRQSIAERGDSTGQLRETLTWLRARTREIVSQTADAMEAD